MIEAISHACREVPVSAMRDGRADGGSELNEALPVEAGEVAAVEAGAVLEALLGVDLGVVDPPRATLRLRVLEASY